MKWSLSSPEGEDAGVGLKDRNYHFKKRVLKTEMSITRKSNCCDLFPSITSTYPYLLTPPTPQFLAISQ